MSPTHKVRRYFIIICFLSFVFLVGFSLKLFSTWDVRHFSQPKESTLEPDVHGHRSTPTLKLVGQALKHMPLTDSALQKPLLSQSYSPGSQQRVQDSEEASQESRRLEESLVIRDVQHRHNEGGDSRTNHVALEDYTARSGDTHEGGSVKTTHDSGSLGKARSAGSLGKTRDAGYLAGPWNPSSKRGSETEEPGPGVGREDTATDKLEGEPGKEEAEKRNRDAEKSAIHRQSGEDALGRKAASLLSGTQMGRKGDSRPEGDRMRVVETRGGPARGTDSTARPLNKGPLRPSSLSPGGKPDPPQNQDDEFQRGTDRRTSYDGAAIDGTREKSDLSQSWGNEIRYRTDRLTDHEQKLQAPDENFVLHQKLIPVYGTKPRAHSNSMEEDFHDNLIQRPPVTVPNSEKRKPEAQEERDGYHDTEQKRNPKPRVPSGSSSRGHQGYEDRRRTLDSNSRFITKNNDQSMYPNFGRMVHGQWKKSEQQKIRILGALKRKQDAAAHQNVSKHSERLRQRIKGVGQMGAWSQGSHGSAEWTSTRDTEMAGSDVGAGESGVRADACQHCFHSNFPTLIDHPSYCRDFSANTVVLLLISSAPSNTFKRQAIRATWGSRCRDPHSNYRCLFVLGDTKTPKLNDTISMENDRYNDIVQFGFKDDYSNLTYKTLMALHWVASRCADVRYVMKTDDDMYVNTELIPVLLTAVPRNSFMGGYCWGYSSPSRDFRSKWYVPFHTFKHAHLPPMCSGTGYIMSRDVVRKVLDSSENIPFFHLEDVYVALCLQQQGIRPVRISGFHNTYVDFDACHYRRDVMTSHQVPTYLLEKYWEQAQQCPGRQASGDELFQELPYPPT